MDHLTLGSLFSGSGGFELAGAIFGITPLWESEIEPLPIRVTERNFPDCLKLGDISLIHGWAIPKVDIIAGGSPCQDMSIAGKRNGLAGSRSCLFNEQIRIVKEMREDDRSAGRSGQDIRCRWMCWENVPGAFTSNQKKDFQSVLTEIVRVADPKAPDVPIPEKGWPYAGCLMGEHGDWSVAYRTLDAKFWGVPQRRSRIYLVADFGGSTAPEILFERNGLSRNFEESRKAWERVAGHSEANFNPSIGGGQHSQ
jgi:DNA (cytosine-5)-methyltransferase 1